MSMTDSLITLLDVGSWFRRFRFNKELVGPLSIQASKRLVRYNLRNFIVRKGVPGTERLQ